MGQAFSATNTKLIEDYFFWRGGQAEAERFYAGQPPPTPGVMPQDFDFTPHTKAQRRVMRHTPSSPFEAFLVVDTMTAWTEDGGDVPLTAFRGLKTFISRMIKSAKLDEAETALAASIIRPSRRDVEERASLPTQM